MLVTFSLFSFARLELGNPDAKNAGQIEEVPERRRGVFVSGSGVDTRAIVCSSSMHGLAMSSCP